MNGWTSARVEAQYCATIQQTVTMENWSREGDLNLTQ